MSSAKQRLQAGHSFIEGLGKVFLGYLAQLSIGEYFSNRPEPGDSYSKNPGAIVTVPRDNKGAQRASFTVGWHKRTGADSN